MHLSLSQWYWMILIIIMNNCNIVSIDGVVKYESSCAELIMFYPGIIIILVRTAYMKLKIEQWKSIDSI